MQEETGNRKSTQPGWPARQSQIRHHALRIPRHSLRRNCSRRGFAQADAPQSLRHVPRRFGARPVAASLGGVA